MSQYVREQWGTERGFPRGPVYSIQQTPDGYLWIGTEKGLFRFDGLTFREMKAEGNRFPPLRHVLGLATDPEGALWVRLRRPTLLRYRNGVFEDALERLGRPRASAAAMASWPNGGPLLWLLEGEASAVAVRGSGVEEIAAPSQFSRSPVLALARTPDGGVWVGTRDAGLFRLKGGQTVPVTKGLPDLKVNALVAAGSGLWVGTDAGVVRWDGAALTKAGVPRELDSVQALAMLVDQDDNLWVGTSAHGLLRVNAQGVASSVEAGRGAVTALFEDKERNLWIGSGTGLERLRDSAFLSYSAPEGIASGGSNPLYLDPRGRLWFAPVDGGLEWMEAGRTGRVHLDGLDRDVVYSITGSGGEIWVGRRHGGLTRLRLENGNISARTYTQRDGLAQDSVYSVQSTAGGDLWAGTLSGGVSRFRQGRFTTYTRASGLPSNTVNTILQTRDGTVWIGTAAGLSALAQEHWRTYGTRDGLPAAEVHSLLEDASGTIWIGTSGGLAFHRDGRIQTPAAGYPSLREPVFGIAEDRGGSLWVSGPSHVFRLPRGKLLKGPLAEGDVREFGPADGLRGVEGARRHRSLVTDREGRIWVGLNRGISVVDPARLVPNTVPALPRVEAVIADGTPVPLHGGRHLPPRPQRVTLRYASVCLAVPEGVRFRYRLEPFDHAWSETTALREAVYTNLPPGDYRFKVIAANPDGVWSDSEAAVAFSVDPLFWQTVWFRLSLASAALLGLAALYRLRMYQRCRQMNLRFEERLAERTRIAQELHDTLLQGFISASMQVHVAADRLPADSEVKPTLHRAIGIMRQVIEEGRNSVRGLRLAKSTSLGLEAAFLRVPEELGAEGKDHPGAGFRVIVEGEPRPLHPLLRDEVYRIGREALLNSFRHARASRIELQLQYSAQDLRLVVQDNGRGIDPGVLDGGRDGHWGLSGMREKAEQIGARFRVWSSGAAGTEIELVVPGVVAFEDHQRRVRGWWKRYFPSKTREGSAG